MSTSALHPSRGTAFAVAVLAVAALAAPGRAAAGYGWPVAPFHAQHPVRAYFGDPRIGRDHGPVTRSLHFGIDIAAANGTPVYPVASGQISIHPLHPDVVLVASAGVTFEYWHIVPAVRGGSAVAGQTVLGHVERPWGHVHFSERHGSTYVNPLRPGAIAPYRDGTPPTIVSVRRLRESLVVEAYDTTPLAVPPPWAGLPVAPALVEWRTGGSWHAAVDFRDALPATSFEGVYGAGTRQNHVRQPGRYRYVLRGAPVNADVEVRVADTAGNATTATYPTDEPANASARLAATKASTPGP
jgi:hypothetical protein